ncbi:MAG: hypothetical protein ABIG32_02940 [Candidatus Uhrbacteria bacterium]|nr:hypothetical protein [Patescibacteria group bacterium]MBU1907439.1 hypothetical protein [Patescibacteria group bacterium]
MRKIFYTALAFSLYPSLASAAAADEALGGLSDTAEVAGYEEGSVVTIVAGVINVVLGALGLVFVILIIYGGILWMTAMGDKERLTKAKTVLTSAIVGILIVVGAYAISTYVVTALVGAVS